MRLLAALRPQLLQPAQGWRQTATRAAPSGATRCGGAVSGLSSVDFAPWILQGKLNEALEGLLNLEKSARQAEDIGALRAACSAVLTACFDAGEWKLLEENVVLLSKRRGQLRQVGGRAFAGAGAGTQATCDRLQS
jgi:hypothetical protein